MIKREPAVSATAFRWAIAGVAVGIISLVGAIVFVLMAMDRIDRMVERHWAVSQEWRANFEQVTRDQMQAGNLLGNTNHQMMETSRLLDERLRDVGAAEVTNAKLIAWLTLTSGTSGNFGKSDALQYLSEQDDVSFTGLDLSCPALGETPDDCPAPVRLERMYLEGQGLNELNFSHAELFVLRVTGGQMSDILLDYATLRDVVFTGSRLSRFSARHGVWHGVDILSDGRGVTDFDLSNATLRGGTWSQMDLHNARFDDALLEFVRFEDVDFFNVSFRGAGLSGARFENVAQFDEADFTGAWAWRDQAPEGLDLSLITLCDIPADYRNPGSSPVRGLPRPNDCG